MQHSPKSIWQRLKKWFLRGFVRSRYFWYNLTHKEYRQRAYRTIKRFVRRNGLIVSVAFLTWQIAQERNKRNQLEDDLAKAETALAASTTRAAQKSITMDDFWRPWFEVTKYGEEWRFTGLNKAYQKAYDKSRMEVLGRNMKDVFPPEIADQYRAGDSLAHITGDTLTIVENDPRGEYLLVVEKLASIYGGDSIVRGFTFPLRRLVKLVDSTDHMEVIEIVPDSVPNAIQDTIFKK